jgi:hypothetical protein
MIIKRCNRYYCEFCGKSGGAAWAMKKHEKYCTLNPNRRCRMCELIKQKQSDYVEIIAHIQKTQSGISHLCPLGTTPENDAKWEGLLDYVREKTDNCPACILAAYRQAGVFMATVTNFDYKKECQEFFAEYNDNQYDECRDSSY